MEQDTVQTAINKARVTAYNQGIERGASVVQAYLDLLVIQNAEIGSQLATCLHPILDCILGQKVSEDLETRAYAS